MLVLLLVYYDSPTVPLPQTCRNKYGIKDSIGLELQFDVSVPTTVSWECIEVVLANNSLLCPPSVSRLSVRAPTHYSDD